MPRVQFLDFLKGVLIFLVVTGHVLQHGIYQWQGHWQDPLFKAIYLFHMPLFMAVAGYLSQPGIERISAWQAIQSRFTAYIVPVIVWSTLYCLAVSVLIDHLSHETIGRLPAYLFKQITSDLWFLGALFGSVVVTALTRLTGRHFAIFYPLSFLAVLCLPEYGNLILFKFTYPFFQIGYGLAKWGIPGFFTRKPLTVFLAALIPAAICYTLFRTDTYVYNSGMALTAANASNLLVRFGGALSGSVAVIYALQFLYGRLSGGVKGVFDAFGRDSIYIYIIQNYVFMVVDRICDRVHVPKPSMLTGWLIALAAGFLICGGCYLGGRLLARNAFLATLLFGKKSRRPAPSGQAAAAAREAT
ncbi:MAG: acetyltransferase, fucose-4-O-acetylase [Akkermansiaceae bacterium]|nr:acetyltransferase, fucose-4-O-acetylase [Akkermansiaceae bacterium]